MRKFTEFDQRVSFCLVAPIVVAFQVLCSKEIRYRMGWMTATITVDIKIQRSEPALHHGWEEVSILLINQGPDLKGL
jgi:hypothetical protein